MVTCDFVVVFLALFEVRGGRFSKPLQSIYMGIICVVSIETRAQYLSLSRFMYNFESWMFCQNFVVVNQHPVRSEGAI